MRTWICTQLTAINRFFINLVLLHKNWSKVLFFSPFFISLGLTIYFRVAILETWFLDYEDVSSSEWRDLIDECRRDIKDRFKISCWYKDLGRYSRKMESGLTVYVGINARASVKRWGKSKSWKKGGAPNFRHIRHVVCKSNLPCDKIIRVLAIRARIIMPRTRLNGET